MICLNKQDMKKVFSMKEAIEADKQAFRVYSQGKSVVPLRVNIPARAHQGQMLFMPGYVEELDSAGIKIVSVFPKNIEIGRPSVPATMILLDGKVGEVCAILDGTYLTQLRTGAAAGAATDILARPDAKIGAVFGTGGQSATQIEAMLSVRKLEQVRVFDIDTERAKVFAAKVQEELKEYGVPIIAAASPEATICDADIITTVTTARKPVFDGHLVKQGAHINAVGAYTPEMQEIDAYLVARADKVYVDSREAALSEAGDLIIPIRAGKFSKEKITGELGEVILGRIPSRESAQEITIFKTVGIAIQDVVTAYHIYTRACEKNIGAIVDL